MSFSNLGYLCCLIHYEWFPHPHQQETRFFQTVSGPLASAFSAGLSLIAKKDCLCFSGTIMSKMFLGLLCCHHMGVLAFHNAQTRDVAGNHGTLVTKLRGYHKQNLFLFPYLTSFSVNIKQITLKRLKSRTLLWPLHVPDTKLPV